jgi:HlyD family secretion protein
VRHRKWRLRWPVLATVAVVVAGSGTAYAVTNEGSTGSYRTVRAARGNVEQVLATSGTVDAARRADLEFGTAGTVARVVVGVGDRVRAGQVVARLDTQALEAAVTRAKAEVARAVAQLGADEDAQAQAVADAASTPKASTPKSNAPTASPTGGASPTDKGPELQALQDQQTAVVQAQSAATGALAVAKQALAAQTAACTDAFQDPADEAAKGATKGAGQGDDADDTACSAALAEVQARQDDVGAAQDALAKALATLAGTLDQAVAALAASSAAEPTQGGSTPSSGDTTPPAPSAGSDGSGSDASGSVSAARLASDQAAIEKARADLVEARQQLGQTVLRSTRSGTVVSLPVAAGDEVAAGDVGAVVVGGKAVTIEGSVPSSKVSQVKVGEKVRVTTPGQSGTAEGTVTAVGLVADTSTGTATYPVTVTVEDPTIPLSPGSHALLAVVVATARDVVTVPTSAVTRRGDTASVRTWDGKTLSHTAVKLGAIGAREVEVTGGLRSGDEVVLADLDQAITGAADSVNDRGGFTGVPLGKLRGSGPGGGPITFKSGP